MKLPTNDEIRTLARQHLDDPKAVGWQVRLRDRFDYCTVDECYEALVDNLVQEGSRWIDVGGGKAVFPNNARLSRQLAKRCGLLVGVDPSKNVLKNPFVHKQVVAMIEDYEADVEFEVVTLRMVAEHVTRPEAVVQSLSQLLRASGHVVICTPNRWSLLSIVAMVVPERFHAPMARLVSPTRLDEDVFPTCYRMNTRRDLQRLFGSVGFEEVFFKYLADCNVFQRSRVGSFLELSLWKLSQLLRLRYPESNILAVYRKSQDI